MSDLQLIEGALQRAARRRRWDRALRGLWHGLLAGTLIWLVTLATYKLAPVPYAVLGYGALAALAVTLAGLIAGGWRATPLREAARWVDGQEHLQERLSTALEFGKQEGGGAWRDLVVADAVEHAKKLDPRRLVKFSLPAACRWTLLVMALATGLGFMPEYRSKTFSQKQKDDKNIKEAGRQLAELTKRSLVSRPPALETTQKAMEAVGELGDQLTKQTLTRSEALKDIASVTDKLKDQLKEMGKDPALKRMEQAARAGGGTTSPEVARLQKQIEEAEKQGGIPTGTPDQMDQMRKKMDKLEEAAKSAMDKNGGMSQQEKESLSKSLAALGKQAQEMGMQMPNLDAAIAALAANQPGMMLKDLKIAADDLEKLKDMTKSLQQMQMQMEKTGKDLPEQLKNGQAEAAQSTLQKMIDKLAANPSPEALQKLRDEVARAVDPASPYGKAAQHLKDATGKMQSGDQGQAAKSLAAAKKELDDLMKQLSDAAALTEELNALNKASQCVGTCTSWGQCQNPGSKPGGKPGRGVGTWADENSGWGYDGHQETGWDNSGIQRADREGRGTADRGDAELNPALRPDKVKGQFSPGGQMPSITLKGISIKGQSKVAYEETAATAQADAQSALSQEKVPRAYQGAVRDYFDDLKK